MEETERAGLCGRSGETGTPASCKWVGSRWWLSLPFHRWILVFSFETLLAEIVPLSGETNWESPGYYFVTDWLRASYTDVKGTSRRVLRNKGIKYKHLQSGCRELAFVGNWEMNGGGERESLRVASLIRNGQ